MIRDKALRFYTDVLGFRKKEDIPHQLATDLENNHPVIVGQRPRRTRTRTWLVVRRGGEGVAVSGVRELIHG